MCLIYSNKTIRIIYQPGMLTASNESLSAKPFHSVTSAYLGREKPPMLVIIERERERERCSVRVRFYNVLLRQRAGQGWCDKIVHYHNIRMFCMKITVITLGLSKHTVR